MPSVSPNILCIIADDLGVFNLSCSHAAPDPFFATPHLDQLAAEGVRFTRAYATAPVCSPARASLYTGIHPARLHVTDFIPGSRAINPPLLPPPWRQGLPVAEVTLGDALKARGYATAHFGKWHLAPDYNYVPGRPMDPESQGFDEVFVTRKPLPDANPEGDPHHIAALTERAIEFCTRSRDRPYFCVVAHNAVHRPEIAPAALRAKYTTKCDADPEVNRPVLGAMIEQLDTATGRLLHALAASGHERETIVVFTADHGPLGPSERRKPLRGAKADLYEGGLRVPLLIRWPERIRPGQLREHVVSTMDLFPTLLAACNARHSGTLDGCDLWPIIDDAAGSVPRDTMYWHYPHYHHLGRGPSGAIRAGEFKLIEWFAPTPRHELYNVASDPAEVRDLAPEDPVRARSMLERLHAWRREIGAQEMTLNRSYNPAAATEILPPASDAAPELR